MKRKILIALGLLIVVVFGGLVWFDATYSMEEVKPYELGLKESDKQVLIATQGSEYKNELVKDLTDYLVLEDAFISVVDVTQLPEIEPTDWDAIVILHTWEIWEPQEDAANFLKEHYVAATTFVVTTSAAGDEGIDGVDAITGASIISDIPRHFEQLKQLISTALKVD